MTTGLCLVEREGESEGTEERKGRVFSARKQGNKEGEEGARGKDGRTEGARARKKEGRKEGT